MIPVVSPCFETPELTVVLLTMTGMDGLTIIMPASAKPDRRRDHSPRGPRYPVQASFEVGLTPTDDRALSEATNLISEWLIASYMGRRREATEGRSYNNEPV
jgi:hypothetical protein